MTRRASSIASWRWYLPLLVVAVLSSVQAVGRPSPERLQLDQVWGAPTSMRPLGSGEGGIDLAGFVAHACVRALLLSAVVALFAALVGVPLGAAAAMIRGRFELLLVRSCDLVQAFPTFLLALAVLSAVEAPARWHLGIVFLLTAWAPFARMAHAQSRAVVASEFVLAARAMGATQAHLIGRHLIPHLVGPVTVQLGSCAAGIVLSESALGFIGLGPSDGVSLGALLEQGTIAMLRDGRILTVAALAIIATNGSLQLASEGLRRSLLARRGNG